VIDSSINGPPIRLVISGGIGSGKSTVAARLRELGAAVIEADVIGHEVLEVGGAAHDAVAQRWPTVVTDGLIDRSALAEIVFADMAQLRDLEAITHPAIAGEISRLVAAARTPIVAVELPIRSGVAGPGWIRVVVEAPEDIRVRRAVARGGVEADVLRRVAAQPSNDEWRAEADHVVINNGTRAELIGAVDALWAQLMSFRGGEPPTVDGE